MTAVGDNSGFRPSQRVEKKRGTGGEVGGAGKKRGK